MKPANSSAAWYLAQCRQLISRLERISADSRVAHRASGVRGELWRWLPRLEVWQAQAAMPDSAELERLGGIFEIALSLLNEAAREIPDRSEGDTQIL